MKCVLRYKTLDGLMLYFKPDVNLGESRELITGDYPTLLDINAVFGSTASRQWLVAQLENLNEFCNCRNKFTLSQIDNTSCIISEHYKTLKISELWVFFRMFKAGEFGRFYGSLDPMVVTTSLKEFMKYRNLVYAEYERQKESDRVFSDAHNPNAITYEEYLKRKKCATEIRK
jgi:hypothetical protein